MTTVQGTHNLHVYIAPGYVVMSMTAQFKGQTKNRCRLRRHRISVSPSTFDLTVRIYPVTTHPYHTQFNIWSALMVYLQEKNIIISNQTFIGVTNYMINEFFFPLFPLCLTLSPLSLSLFPWPFYSYLLAFASPPYLLFSSLP